MLIFLFPLQSIAGSMEGGWLFNKDAGDFLDRALYISGSSFQSLISTPEGVAWESGWWTENPSTNKNRTSVIVRYGDDDPETIEYEMNGSDRGVIYKDNARWGWTSRMRCNLSIQYRDKNSLAPEGCGWLHIKGWGYDGLEGDCRFDEEWVNLPPSDNPMECLIEAPIGFTK